jgi:hypothetical protein
MARLRSRSGRVLWAVAVWATAVLVGWCATAEETPGDAGLKLAGELPEDTLFYGYFCGWDKLKETSGGTALGQMLADPEAGKLPEAMGGIISSLAKWGVAQMTEAGVGEGVEEMAAVEAIAAGLAHHPSYTAVLPGPRAIVIVEAGDEAKGLAEDTGELLRGIGKLLEEAEGSGLVGGGGEVGGRVIEHCRLGKLASLAWTADRGRFVIAAGREESVGTGDAPEIPMAVQVVAQMTEGRLKGSKSLAESETFGRVAVRSGFEGALDLSYVDVRGVVSSVEELLPENAKAAIEASGLKSLAAIGQSARFDAPGIREKGFAWFPEGREGIFQALMGSKITDEELLWIPRDVIGVSAGSIDAGMVCDRYLQVVEAASEETAEEIRSGLAEVKEEVGIDMREDVLVSLGNKVIFYSLGAGLSPFLPRTVVVMEAKNEAKLKECLERLFFYYGAKRALSMPEESPAFWTMEIENFGSRKVYYVKLSESPWAMSPAVAVEDGRVVAALAVGDVKEALTRERTRGSSIFANEDFAQCRKRLPAASLMVTYTDSKKSYEANCGMILMQAKMMSAVTGTEMDLSALPAAAVSQHLFGSVGVAVEAGDGIVWECYSAIPGIEAVPMVIMAAVAVPMATKGMSMGRKHAKAAACKNNLKMIGLALHIYATDHEESFPKGKTAAAVISELVEGDYLPSYEGYGVFMCPAAEADQKAWERTKKISAATVSYRWVAGLKAVSRPDFIMMYDKSVEHHKDGRNVLCVDGHVEWMKEEEFQKRLAEQRDKMREMRAGRR